MLKSYMIRFTFKKQITVFSRCLADKPSDSKPPEDKLPLETKEEKASDSNVDRIQELLKSMMTEPKITESEYKEKFVTAPVVPRRRKQRQDEIEVTSEKIEESITKSAAEVAQAIGGDVKQTEAELLSKVLGKINQTSTTLSDLLIGMKVDRSKDSDDLVKQETRGQQVKRLVEKSRVDRQNTRYVQKKTQPQRREKSLSQAMTVNIFESEPLGIFTAREANFGTKLDVWDSLKQRELTLATAQPPANYFEKMILWTNQGKVWKFPIDNEQGIEEEQNVHFSEHIFLESHLEGWCPTKGPIKHFMELVCVGLSKNAFYTVQEKKDHIMWYKEYFESKKDVLVEVGAWNVDKSEKNETSV